MKSRLRVWSHDHPSDNSPGASGIAWIEGRSDLTSIPEAGNLCSWHDCAPIDLPVGVGVDWHSQECKNNQELHVDRAVNVD